MIYLCDKEDILQYLKNHTDLDEEALLAIERGCERIAEKAYDIGRNDGYDDGYDRGYDAGCGGDY